MIDIFKEAHVAMGCFAEAMKAGMHFLQAEEVLRVREEKKRKTADAKQEKKKKDKAEKPKKERAPTPYNIFMKAELARVKAPSRLLSRPPFKNGLGV